MKVLLSLSILLSLSSLMAMENDGDTHSKDAVTKIIDKIVSTMFESGAVKGQIVKAVTNTLQADKDLNGHLVDVLHTHSKQHLEHQQKQQKVPPHLKEHIPKPEQEVPSHTDDAITTMLVNIVDTLAESGYIKRENVEDIVTALRAHPELAGQLQTALTVHATSSQEFVEPQEIHQSQTMEHKGHKMTTMELARITSDVVMALQIVYSGDELEEKLHDLAGLIQEFEKHSMTREQLHTIGKQKGIDKLTFAEGNPCKIVSPPPTAAPLKESMAAHYTNDHSGDAQIQFKLLNKKTGSSKDLKKRKKRR